MASSRISRILVACAVAAIGVVSAVNDYATAFREYTVSAAARVFRVVVSAFKVDPPFQSGQAPKTEQGLALVMAKAFKRRIEGRDRPTVTPRWRMCPSA